MPFPKLPTSRTLPRNLFPLLFYSLIILMIYFADGVMSYISPVLIEGRVGNSFTMGLILSVSSLVGICCDIFFPNAFKAKHHLFFLWNTVLIALLFPLIYLFFPHVLTTFLAGMVIWGIYFEFLIFSNFFFIHAFISREHRALAWGMITIFRSIGIMFAPIIASTLLHQHQTYPLFAVIFFLCVSLLAIFCFTKLFPFKKQIVISTKVEKRYGFKHEFGVWRILFKKIWPIYLFVFILYALESTFFTVGVLLTEEMAAVSFWGDLVIVAYYLPNLFTGFVVEKICDVFGKKKTAFLCGIAGGVLLVASYFVLTPMYFIFMIFCSSLFTSMALPSVLSAIQDYVGRLGKHKGDMVGLQNSAGSFAYIIGPILAGGIALEVGNKETFAVIGGILIFVSVINFIFVPKKIYIPHREIGKVR
jgi:MFS family permease